MSDCALIVFARAPVPGQVKTRLYRADPASTQASLGRQLSAEDAACLHHAFVRDVLQKGLQAGFARRVLYAADAVEHPALQSLADELGYQLKRQHGADLGERMSQAIAAELASVDPRTGQPPGAVVLIGTDSPTLPRRYLQLAQVALSSRADVVLGPASDGGYYLVGMRQPLPSLFAAPMRWGSDEVLPRTLERLRAAKRSGLRPVLLPFFYDCDTPADLRLLRDHLDLSRPAAVAALVEDGADELAIAAPATAAVLHELGLL